MPLDASLRPAPVRAWLPALRRLLPLGAGVAAAVASAQLWRHGIGAGLGSDLAGACGFLLAFLLLTPRGVAAPGQPDLAATLTAAAAELRRYEEATSIIGRQAGGTVETTERVAMAILGVAQQIDDETAALAAELRQAEALLPPPGEAGGEGLDHAVLRALLDTAQGRAGKVEAWLRDLVAQMQFQDIVRQRLEQVTGAADQLGRHAGLVAAALQDGQDPPSVEVSVLRPMQSAYVMAAQHDTHAQGSAPPRPREPVIELF